MSASGSSPIRRLGMVLLVLVVLAAAAAAGWAWARRQYPPPQPIEEPRPVTAPVVRQQLDDLLVLRGRVELPASTDVDPPLGDGAEPVVTARNVDRGDEVGEGAVPVVVAGRPVILLRGEVPPYRPLTPGSRGPDVAQLQAALARLGHYDAEVDGVFGPATAAGVQALYADAGFDPVPTSTTVEADERAARGAVQDAEDTVADAEENVADAQADVADAEQAVADAKQDAAEAAARTETPSPDDATATADPESSTDGIGPAEAANLVEAAEEALEAARDVLDDARDAVGDARDQFDDARFQLAQFLSSSGPTIPLGEVVFVADLPALVVTIDASVGERVGSSGGGDASPAGQAPEAAGASSPMMTLSPSRAVVTATLPGAVDVVVDTPAIVTDENDGRSYQGLVSATDGADGAGTVTVALDEDVSALVGRDVRVEVTVPVTDGPVLAVPLAAVYTGTDGGAHVVRMQGDDRVHVPVDVGAAGGGLVAVTVRGDARLAVDDEVVVAE